MVATTQLKENLLLNIVSLNQNVKVYYWDVKLHVIIPGSLNKLDVTTRLEIFNTEDGRANI